MWHCTVYSDSDYPQVPFVFLSIPVPPATNKRLKAASIVRKKGRNNAGKRYLGLIRTKEVTQYQDSLRQLTQQVRFKTRTQPIQEEVEVVIHWARNQSIRGDVPDRWKDVCDGLQPHIYLDDAQIRRFLVERFDGFKSDPHIEMWIRRWRQTLWSPPNPSSSIKT